jgi:hypothetical protein
MSETIETRGHTTGDGMLNLCVDVGLADTNFAVVLQVRVLPRAEELDENGWPIGFFERVAGSMPELTRPAQGTFEERLTLK